MSYSLLSRFRGALIGSMVSEGLSLSNVSAQAKEVLCGDEIATSAQSLISPGAAASTAVSATRQELHQALASIIPIALYGHDNPQSLGQMITDTTPQPLQAAALVIANIITAALTHPSPPFNPLPALIQQVTDESLCQSLQQLEGLLNHRESLAISLQTLGDPRRREVSIALALYCWLSTPEQFQLSVLRAHRIPHVSPLTLSLTGAFSGALNGQAAMPLPWLQSTVASRSNIESMEKLADQLLATWSGCYHSDPVTADTMKAVAVSAPGLLRPR
ncbi:MAG: ADP-ribosylglycohydrolase family protein [Thermosynechococcaceae cyanobacterium]